MDDHTRLLDTLRRSHDGEPWHGPSLRELLADVDHVLAASHPVPGAHTIWEIVRHLSVWMLAVRRRMAGEVVEHDGVSDWPRVTSAGEAAWLATLDVLEQAHRAIVRVVEAMPADALYERVPGKDYTVAHMLHGVVQHTAYHSGQIALLKRVAREGAATAARAP
jgi:hypothetical protein